MEVKRWYLFAHSHTIGLWLSKEENAGLVSQNIAFSIALCCCLASSVYAIRIRDQNGLIFYLSRQDDKWVSCFNTQKNFKIFYHDSHYSTDKRNSVYCSVNHTISMKAENSWILEKWMYFTIKKILKRLETALILWKSIWKTLLAVAQLMKVRLPSECWKDRTQKKKC